MADNIKMGLEHLNNDLSLKSCFYDTKDDVDMNIVKSKYFISNELVNRLKTGTYFLSLNCCSLLSKFDNIKMFISQFAQNLPVAILLQEIHKFPDFFDPCIDGFNFFHKKRLENKGGGVGIYVRNDFSVKEFVTPFDENEFESIGLRISKNNSSFIACSFYRPPQADFAASIDRFANLCNIVSCFNLPSFIACDSNINILNLDQKADIYLNEAFGSGFIDQIGLASRFSGKSKTAIDQFYSNCPDNVSSAGVIVDSPSDHFWTFLHLDSFNCCKNDSPLPRRIFSKTNLELFYKNLSTTDWASLYSIEDVNQCANQFSDTFAAVFEQCFPRVITKSNKKLNKIEPWFTEGLLTSRRKKCHLFNLWKGSGKASHRDRFVKYRNLFNKLKAKARRDYFAIELLKHGKSSKKHWKLLKDACGMKNSSKTEKDIELTVSSNGKKVTDSVAIADMFNDYFSGIGHRTAATVPPSNIDHRKYLNSISNSFSFLEMGPWKLLEIVDRLNDKFTQDVNDVSIWLLKNVIEIIAEPLSYVFDLSICNGVFPEAFKCAKVVPVFKKSGKEDDITMYRPISIINSFGKILEKYASDQLLSFLLKNNVLLPNQHGFLPGKSTFSCHLDILNFISNASLNGKYTAAIFLDISKAFDTCCHSIILDKLFAYGVRGIPYNFFKSFLSNRTQKVFVNNSFSSSAKNITLGVPQGSVLGVLFFLIYINDLPLCSNFLTLIYADDSTFLMSDCNDKDLEAKVTTELSTLNEWFAANKFSLNLKKSNFMVFSPSLNKSPRLNLNIPTIDTPVNIEQIPKTDGDQSFKLLGIQVDERLNLKNHISNICKSLNRSLFFLSRVKHFLPLYCRKQLYFAHIHSILIYCLPLLSMAYKTDLNRLEKLQRKAVRIIFNANFRADTMPLFHNLEALALSDLIERSILKFMHNIYSYKKPKELVDFWPLTISNDYLLRSSIRFQLPLVKTVRLSYMPQFKFPSLFNNFPADFKLILERSDFNHYLEEFYHKKYSSMNCKKTFCKFCAFNEWKLHKAKYAISHKSYSYIRY